MRYFERFKPRGAWADLRYFIRLRQPHQVVFAILAVMFTVGTLAAFWVDSRFEPEYHRDIVYVEQWPLTRSDAQIIAQQKVDAVIKTRRLAAEKRQEDARRAEFQRVKDKLDSLGL